MAFFLNPAQREGTALLEDSFCAGKCGQQRHNIGHTSGDCALPPPPPSAPLSPPPPQPSAPLSTPAPPSAATSPAAATTTTRTRWLRGRALGGGVQSGPTAVGASTALDGPARRRPGASARRRVGAPARRPRWMARRVGALVRRRVGASALLRVDAPAPRRPGARCQRGLCPPAGMAGAPRGEEIESLHDKPKPRLCAGSNDRKNYA